MPLNSRIAFVGISKQSVKGTAVTPPTFGFGLRSGQVHQTDIDQSAEELTSTDRFAPTAFRDGVLNRVQFTTRLYPRMFGLLAFGSLGASSPSGTTPNFTHTATVSSALTTYLTAFGRLDTEHSQIRDCRVDELSITWDGAAPPEVSCTMVGTVLTYGSSWTATNDESSEEIIPTAGGTFKVDTGSATAVVANISGGSVTISNSSSPVTLSKSIEPDDIWPGLLDIEYTLRMVPDNLQEWRKIVTGASGGTTVQTTPVYGSVDLLFSLNANRSVQISSNKVAFVADYPEADPSGAPVELTVVGKAVKTGTTPITIVTKNATASY